MFVDIPGFSDTERNESETVHYISKLLLKVPDITGILYLHRISDDRMLGSSVRHLRVFHAFCGSSCMRNVLILTTHWDRTPREVGEARENELREHYWNELISNGARVMQFDTRTPECAQDITKSLMCNQPLKLAIQKQMEQHRTFEKTDVGRIVNEELQRLLKHDQPEIHPEQEDQAHHHGGTMTSRMLVNGELRRHDQLLHHGQGGQEHRQGGTTAPRGPRLGIVRGKTNSENRSREPGRLQRGLGYLKAAWPGPPDGK